MKKISQAKKNTVRKLFYQECIKENMTADDVDEIISVMFTGSSKDVMAGIKASKQKRRNEAGRKAALTRKRRKAKVKA